MRGLIEGFDKEEDADAAVAPAEDEMLDYINEKISFSDLMLLLMNDLDEYDEGVIGDNQW